MGEKENRQAIESMWAYLEKKDWDSLYGLLHDDHVREWPQSGERVVGKENDRAINENYPGFPTIDVRRIIGSGDLWVAEASLDYGGEKYESISVFEFKDGKIARSTDYFSQPFEAPDWRSKWVEKM